MIAPVHLVPKEVCHETIDMLQGLLTLAKDGQLTGIVVGCALRRQRFFFESAGSLHTSPMMGIAAASQLTYELNSRVRRSNVDTMF